MTTKKIILDNKHYKFTLRAEKRSENQSFNYIDFIKYDKDNGTSAHITIFDHENSIHIRKSVITNAPLSTSQKYESYMFESIRDLELKKIGSLEAKLNLFGLVIKETLKTKNTDQLNNFYMLEELINNYAPIEAQNKLIEKRD